MIRLINDDNREVFVEWYGEDMLAQAEQIKLTEEEAAYYDDLNNLSANIVVKTGDIPEGHLLLICGFGDGSFIENALEYKAENTKFFIYEPDEKAFFAACVRRNLSTVLFREDIIIVVGKEDLRVTLESMINYSNANSVRALLHPGYAEVYSEYFSEMIREAQSVASGITVSLNVWKSLGKQSCENELTAFSMLDRNHTVKQLMEKIPTRDVPVIIVGAGPSLNKNVKQLRNAVGKAIIVAVAHAAKTLDDAGVKIDLVAQMDQRQGWNFLDHDVERKHVLLIATYSGTDIQRAYNGRNIYYGSTTGVFDVVYGDNNEKEVDLGGGSVATDMFEIFAGNGFKNIIFVGQDLAFDENGKSHSGYLTEADYGVFQVRGTNGKTVFARGDWIYFLDYYKKRIPVHKGICVIDATEGGALIPGTIVMSLEDAIEKHCTQSYPVSYWIRNVLNSEMPYHKEQIESVLSKQVEYVRKSIQRLEKALSLQKEIMDVCKNVEYEEKYAEYNALYHMITEGDESTLLCAYAQDVVADYLTEIRQGEEDRVQKLATEHKLFEGLLEKAGHLGNFLEKVYIDTKNTMESGDIYDG